MNRRRGHKGEVAFQLFSFLDVLLCTIGALIIILTIVIHRARAQAREEHARKAVPSVEEVKKQEEALEEARWRQEQLEKSRAVRQEELQNARLALSHLEDHIRRLNERGQELLKLLDKVEAGKQAQNEDQEAAKKELAKVKDEIAKKRDELEKKKKEAASAEKWYALIPYDGPNGTRRMPIYIECVAEGVVIQPEGVLLTADDFRGEPGPGNPLDAALRIKREYIMKVTGGKAAEPYPLLVVRPSGVVAYGVARSYMKFWEDEFGYELISEEKKLDFGPRDPNLDLAMSREIAQARKRQAVLALAMPRKYNNDEVPHSFASEPSPDLQRRRVAAAGGGGAGNGESGNGVGVYGTGASSRRGTGSGGPLNGTGSASGPYGSGGDPLAAQNPGLAGTNPGGTGAGGSGGFGPGGSGSGPNPGGSAGGGKNSPATKNSGGPRLTQPGQGTTSPGAGSHASGTPGGPSGGTSENGSTSPSGGTGSSSTSPGGSSGGNSATASGAAGGSSGGASGGTATGAGSVGASSGSVAGGQSMPNIGVNIGPADQLPPANSPRTAKGRGGPGNSPKGKNWGLPEAQRHVTGVTRPIRVTMQKDKLILLPERNDRRPQEIGLSPEMTVKELEALVAGVQRQMRSWGIAVDGGYWKPALSVDVRPGAEDRFAELQSNLSGSGIEVQRKIR